MVWLGFALLLPGLVFLGVGLLLRAAHRARRMDLWVRPTAQVLIDSLPKVGEEGGIGALVRDNPERFVELPRTFPIPPGDSETSVAVHMPTSPGMNERAREKLVKDLSARLGLGESPTASWSHRGHGVTLRLFPTPSFGEPRTVYDYIQAVRAESGNLHRVVLGLDLNGEPVVYDHVTNGPHLKVSAGSGGGKSFLYRFLVPQYIGSGAQVIILDVKGVSLLDLAVSLEFKNIKYYSEAKTAHDALQAVFAELERRRTEDIKARLNGARAVFTPLHVVLEEANTLMAMLRDFWEYAKELHEEAAKHSPAIRSMHYSVYMGREFGIYLHVIAQRAEAQVFGGGAVRENFNAALMTKWDTRTWKMLAHGHKYIPHPMDWSWYLVTSTKVVRYLPPVLQESDATLIADLDNVPDLEWPDAIEAVPDVRVSSVAGYLPAGGGELTNLPNVELAVTLTLDECTSLLAKHGHAVPLSVLRQWQKRERSATSKGYPEWPESVGSKGPAKVYKRTDILEWMAAGPEPKGRYWDGKYCEITPSDLVVRKHVIYGLRVQDFGDHINYVGQTHQSREARTSQHEESQYWGDLITDSVVIFEGEMTCIEAREIEGFVIDMIGTRLNRSIPQVGPDPHAKWNAAAESVEALRDQRHARDVELGRSRFTATR